MGVLDKVKTNLRDRGSSLRRLGDGLASAVRTAGSDLRDLRPVAAICDLGKGVAGALFDFIKEQASITRRWLAR